MDIGSFGSSLARGKVGIACGRYGLGVLVIVPAALIRTLLAPLLGDHEPFSTFYPAVAAAAWYGGPGPALLGIVLGAATGSWLFIEPRYRLTPGNLVDAGTFIAVGLVLLIFGRAARVAIDRARSGARQVLESQRAIEREAADRSGEEEESRTPRGGLEAGRARLEAVVGQMPAGVAIAEAPSGRLVLINDRVSEIWRAPLSAPADFQGYRHGRGSGPDGRPYRPEEWPLARAIATGAVIQDEEVAIERGDGTRGTIDVSSAPLRDAAGAAVGAAAVYCDITGREQDEQALQLAHAQFKTLVENSPDVIGRFDLQHRHLSVNPAVEVATGLPADRFLGKTNRELGMPADCCDAWEEMLRQVEERRTSQCFEFTFPSPQGTRYYLARVVPELAADGSVQSILSIARDETERRRAEDELRRSREWISAIFNRSAIGIAQADLTGRFVLANPRYCQIVGHPVDALLGMRMQEITDPADLPRNEDLFRRLVSGGPDFTIEKRYLRPDGSPVWVSSHISIMKDSAGRPLYVVAFSRDITESKTAEEALRWSRERLRIAYECGPVGIFEVDFAGRFLHANSRYCEILGYTREELLGRSFQDVLHPDDLPANAAVYAQLASGEIPYSRLESRFFRADGRVIWVELTGCLIPGRGEEPGSGIGFAQDITERRRTEGELRRAHAELERRVDERTAELAAANAALRAEVAERARAEEGLLQANRALRALILASPLAIIALDAGGRVTLWNPAAERIFGWGEGEVMGRPIPSIPEGLRDEFAAGLARSLRGGAHEGHETRRLRKDGAAIEVSLWTAPLCDAQGEPCGRVGVVEDITDRKRAEEARRALLRRIVAAQEEERQRIARELHDQMGQHLAALMLGLGALGEQIRSPAAAAEARRIHELADRIGQEVHRIALELRPTALDDWGLERALARHVADWSRRARVQVQSRFDGIDRRRLPPAVETALYRTVQEALTNVMKHARAGRVCLIVERRADHVLAIVEDDGRGFDAEAVMAAPDAAGRLGLLGMQERAALVGGTLEIESCPGGGTSLFVRIPLSDGGEGDHDG